MRALYYCRTAQDVGGDCETLLSDILHAKQSNLAAASACARQQVIQQCINLPDSSDVPQANSYTVCMSSVALMRRCQPALLQGWTPVDVLGDGNCMFRAVSFALYGTEDHHKTLRLHASLEIVDHRYLYDRDVPGCHPVFRQMEIVAPSFMDLLRDVATLGSACCIGALVALSSVVCKPIYSYYPPLQPTFVSPLTQLIVGRGVSESTRQLAVMWTTASSAVYSRL